MSSSRWSSPVRRFAFLGAAVLLAVATASAQLASTPNSSHSASASAAESSSNDFFATDSGSGDGSEPSAAPAGHAAGQYDNGAGTSHGLRSRMVFEAGGGFNSPIGNDGPYITWGGNFTGGAGLRFSRNLSALVEYQFIDNKLPGAFVAAGGGTGGNAHIQSITLDPVLDLFPKANNSVYLVGGGGWYHKSTNFTVQQCCDFYGYPVTFTANSFSSNQLGGSIGIGYSRRLAGMYGEGTTKLFAEARYLFINTPAITQNNGVGTTGLIPVTVGVRF